MFDILEHLKSMKEFRKAYQENWPLEVRRPDPMVLRFLDDNIEKLEKKIKDEEDDMLKQTDFHKHEHEVL